MNLEPKRPAKHATEPIKFVKDGYDISLSATYGVLWFLVIDKGLGKKYTKGPFKTEGDARDWLDDNLHRV